MSESANSTHRPLALPTEAAAGRRFLVRPSVALYALLFAAVAIRIPLVLAGGRFFIADEGRYLRGHYFLYHVLKGDWAAAVAAVKSSDNIGFNVVTLITTAIQHALTGFIPGRGWSVTLERFNEYFVVEAMLLALAPVAAIWLVHRVARRLGASEPEAVCAAFLLSLSNTAFYFSRHLVPYDTSIALALGGILVALQPRGIRSSWLTGLLAGAAFHVYNGYWFLVPLILLVRTYSVGFSRPASWDLIVSTASAGTVVVLPYVAGYAAWGPDFLRATVQYGHSIVQGLYREGWSLPWEYLWHSEGLFGALVIALPLGGAWINRQRPIPARVKLVFLTAAGLYLTWVLVSTVAHRFMMNARTVKPIVPLLCLLGGWGMAECWRRQPRLAALATAALLAFAATNLLPHYWLVFPREFAAAVTAKVGSPKRTTSLSGCYFDPATPRVTAPDYVMVNGQYLYPVRAPLAVPRGETVLSAPHALAYLPYQYDGFTPRQRALLRSSELRMQLIRLADPAATPDLPPSSMRATNEDWPDGFDSEATLATR